MGDPDRRTAGACDAQRADRPARRRCSAMARGPRRGGRGGGRRREVPVGAVLVDGAGAVVAASGNRVERDRDPTAHAEMLVLRAGAARLGRQAARRLRSVRDARAVPDVRRGDRPRAHPPAVFRRLRPERRRRRARRRASSTSRPATTGRKSTAASASAPPPSCCAASSPPGADAAGTGLAIKIPRAAVRTGGAAWRSRAIRNARSPRPASRAGRRTPAT